ncbi:MAG TPA: hypothetical protein VK305_15705 [Roseateles sp.]|nr:hypothetical protein [Roseateles sp.]
MDGTKAGGEAAASLPGKLLAYVAENPAKTLSIGVLTFGGFVLLVYFVHIAFLPDVNLESATSLLYAAAVLGLLVGGYAAVTMVLPGLLIAYTNDARPESRPRDVVVAAVMSAGAWGVVLAWQFLDLPLLMIPALLGAIWLVSVPLVVVLSRAAWRDAEVGPEARGWRLALREVSLPLLWQRCGEAALFCFALLTLPLLLSMAFGLHGDIRYEESPKALASILALMLGFASATIVLGTSPSRNRLKAAAWTAPVLLLMVFVATGSFSAVSIIVVNKLGLGEYPLVRAVVNGKTCRQVNLALGQSVCLEVADEQPTAICPVALRSRIGSQVLLEFAAMSVEARDGRAALPWQSVPQEPGKPVRFRRVVLDKAQLLTWSDASPAVLPAPAASAAAAPVLASWLVPSDKTRGVARQPEALQAALARLCEPVPRGPDVPASGPIAASAPAVIQIDAKGSASHQTVLNLTLSNALSQSASSTSGAAASSKAHTRAAGTPVRCAPVRRCCEPAPAEPQPAACAASAAH